MMSSSSIITLITIYLVTASDTHAFSSFVQRQTLDTRPSSSSSSSSSSKSSLYMISSWGVKGNPAFRTKDKLDPERQIQDYLPEPGPVEARSNIDGTILVSGLVNHKDRTDQFLFDLINHEDSAFEFNNITAFVNDAVFAKKRLLSRSARYTGLLDKLHFIQAAAVGALPTVDDLHNVKTWLAILENTDGNNNQLIEQCEEIGRIAMSAAKSTSGNDGGASTTPTLQNVAIVLAGINGVSTESCQRAVDAMTKLNDVNVQFTIVAVGNLDNTRVEGSVAYQYMPLNGLEQPLPAKATFSREEMYRLITELLQLECGINQALVFAEIYNPNITEAKLIKGLREAGYARPQEIDHMIRNGPKAYKEAIDKFRTENPDAALGYTTDAWWEKEEYQLSRKRSDDRIAATAQAVKDARTIEIEAIAKEWAKREYFRASMAGTVENDMTEDEFVKSVWNRAMLEGDIKLRQSKGETVDENTELATFQSQQERKQQVMLQRAKAELAQVLQEDDGSPDSDTSKADEDDDEEDDDDE